MRSTVRKPRGVLRRWGLGAVLMVWAAPCIGQQGVDPETGTIAGRVVDSRVQPVGGALLALRGTHLTVRSDSVGAFKFSGIAPGYYSITVRRVGFIADTEIVVLAKGSAIYRTITLEEAAVQLPTVKTETVGNFGKPARLAYTMKYDRFYERRHYSTGAGEFYTHEDLVAMHTTDLVDILRRIPFLTVRQDLDRTILRFPDCGSTGIMIEVDSHRVWPPGGITRNTAQLPPGTAALLPGGRTSAAPDSTDPLAYLRPLTIQQVEAIEVYPTSASLPAEMAGDACAGIVIWTR